MKGWFSKMSTTNTTENGALIRKPRTSLQRQGKTVTVVYNPGLMSAERATDLFMGGMALFCAPMYYAIGFPIIALVSAALAGYSIYDGVRRPADETVARAEIYEKTEGQLVQYNPGLMTVERALALILAGFGLVEALCYLAYGHQLLALGVMFVAVWMFHGGIKAPKETTHKLTAAKRAQIQQLSQ